MSATESSEDERPSFAGAGLGANRRKFVGGARSDREGSPAKKMRFSKQSNARKGDETPEYSKAGSFASRMMAQMGYKQGEGLGREGKGRLAPIETQLRPQGAGLGAVKEKTKQAKEEEKREAAFRGEIIHDSSEEERERRKQRKSKRPGASTTASYQKPKIKYRTAREIELESKGLEIPDVLKTLVDVSGNKTELLLTSTPTIVDSEEVKIAKRARRDLEAYAEDWKSLQERKRYYEDEFQRHVHEMNQIQDRASNLEKLLGEMEALRSLKTQDSDLDTVSEMLQLLEIRLHLSREEAFEETIKAASLNIQEITIAAIVPSFIQIMKEWDPLETENPHKVVDSLAVLKEHLGLREKLELVDGNGVSVTRRRQAGSCYDSMINTYWLPVVRNTVVNEWRVEDPEPMTKIVELWTNLLPPFVSSILMNQLIIPRLVAAVKKWRPGHRQEGERGFVRANPDVFLFPWLPMLPSQHLDPQASSSLLSDVRRKFAMELGKYDASWGPPKWTAPWAQVKAFKPALSALYTNHLVPKLAQYVDQIDYSPTLERRTEPEPSADWPLRYLSNWHEMLGDMTMSHLLAAHFFPKLMKATHQWLLTGPVIDQIGSYTQFWHKGMSEDLQKLPAVHKGWKRFSTMIGRAIDLGDSVARELTIPEEELSESDSVQKDNIQDLDNTDDLNSSDDSMEPFTFRDILEGWCEERGLVLLPLHPAVTADGLPLYRITDGASARGGVRVYLQGDVIWAEHQKEKGKFASTILGDQLAARGRES
ncbi:MAG: hypothetical protein GOMPHAMPRED_005113 [Gomphillus americanus]|uniref:G-patch domain-containing protein n=1 Tax=Gomphillus americanus TaxID=1940652 RepID=A0A8H3I773_9LECA|nr:MAG: hypothetical protein GOMPHAMPRED_005113 [Gomphillus americanus]